MEKETILDKITKVVTIAGNFIMMNVLFLLAALPIVTMGQAWTALMTAIRYNIRGDKWLDGFKEGYKTRFLRGVLSWLLMLVLTAIMLFDVMTYTAVEAFSVELVIRLVMSCLMFALVAGFTVALLLLNVYIPTDTGRWISNAASMVFKAPLLLAIAGVALWLPLLLAIFYYNIFYYCIMIFVAAYFTLAALAITLLMKETLIHYLLEARANGTLLGDREMTEEDEENGEN